MALCPHFIQEYFSKVKDIFKTYRAQIIYQVHYSKISDRLQERSVISFKDHQEIFQLSGNDAQIDHLIAIIQRRIGGFERFIMILMEENCSSWITEELFNAYLRHVVAHTRKLKETEKCDCPPTTESSWLTSTVSAKWSQFLEKVDSCVYEIGTSIGFLDQTLYPNKNMLEFINNKLPIRRISRKTISTVSDVNNSVDIEELQQENQYANINGHNERWWMDLSLGNFGPMPITRSIPPGNAQLCITNGSIREINGTVFKTENENTRQNPFEAETRLIYEIMALRIHSSDVAKNETDLRNSIPIFQTANQNAKSVSVSTGTVHEITQDDLEIDEDIYEFSTRTTEKSLEEELLCDNGSGYETSDFEWDYQDMLVKEEESEIHRVDQATQTLSSDSSTEPKKIKESKISPTSHKTPKTKTTPVIPPQENKPKNVLRSPMPGRTRKPIAVQSSPAISSSPFNSTIKQRLSPTEYPTLQKTIEWANKRVTRN